MSRYSDGPEQETFQDIVEGEAAHDYDPEPDYDRPTRADEGEPPPVWQQRLRRSHLPPMPVPPAGSASGATEEKAEDPQHQRGNENQPQDVADGKAAAAEDQQQGD